MIHLIGEDLFTLYDIMKKISTIPMKNRLLKSFYKEYSAIYLTYTKAEDIRNEIIKRYGKTDESGNLILDKDGKAQIVEKYIDECRVELNKLSAESFEILIEPNFYKKYTMCLEDYLVIKKIVKK